MPINRIIDLNENTAPEVKAAHAEINRRRSVERFATQPAREGHVCIVGGGPSLVDCLAQLRWRKESGHQVWATNNTFAFLVANGITPDAHVLLDARAENVAFLHPTPGVTYYLNESCHPSAFEKLAGCKVIMYDLGGAGTGTTVGLKALYLAGFSGYRNFHLFGMDSSYRERQHHAYAQALNDGEEVYEVTIEGVKFNAAAWMIHQAEEFQQIAASLAEQGCVLTVAGDGMLPFIAHRLARRVRILTAVYDLTVCPPTYDFISFLGEAERRRIEIGAEAMDVVFLPGPVDGFREDTLPDSHASRVGMIYRVCVGACRLLPSVRNVELCKQRKVIDAEDTYPPDYRENPERQGYGATKFPTAMPVLESSLSARAFVKKRCKKRYITITLRQSSHWMQRNSNLGAWEAAARYIASRGYEVVWVPDVESPDANAFSWDIDLRLALYEGAELNLGVNNGPMCMLFYANARYIIFKMVTEGIPWCEPPFFEKCGMLEGDVQGGRGRLIWGPDDTEVIIDEVRRYLAKAERAAA